MKNKTNPNNNRVLLLTTDKVCKVHKVKMLIPAL